MLNKKYKSFSLSASVVNLLITNYNLLVSLFLSYWLYLSLIGTIYATHTARALQCRNLSGEDFLLWMTIIILWPHKDMEGLPERVISSAPGLSPKQYSIQTIDNIYSNTKHDGNEKWLWRSNNVREVFGSKVSKHLS